MAKHFLISSKMLIKTIICLFLIAFSFDSASSARILDEENPDTPLPTTAPVPADPVEVDDPDVAPAVAPDSTLPSGQIPANPVNQAPPASVPLPTTGPASVVPPTATAASPVTNPVTATGANPAASGAGAAAGAGAGAGAAVAGNPDQATLSFFMHDILGGSHPSGRVVTGVIANTDANGLPFSKPNNQIFPLNGGVPLNTINGVINNNNFPFLVGLNGQQPNTVLSNSNGGNNVNTANNQPFVTAGQLPAGLTLQQLMFGSVTVVDNQITEGRELDSAVLGRAQGFYLASSLDGSSHTLALTALFHGGNNQEVDDAISFFGIHRTATPISHLAIIGGTGKYENAKGYATIETDLHHEDQHTTDGVETITHFTVYLTP
ncbi:OLC1v1026610C1 [Oldenlandia corymbosa var. corymbosa]|uniref:Dirigent protein n=1 Tax=Oldenlandia corymbosa var. corymbosa TaxID=529605 RepID=A0AAV1C8R2_OLDCO|nr:OLC1v1026610C1 [Oldenlandia corymbosa var. corymbosa]